MNAQAACKSAIIDENRSLFSALPPAVRKEWIKHLPKQYKS
ncbi:hypothetical protein HMPREF9098_1503 [Kingella denitrificans ATCC 33394]|uniref:Uncharacterized protein n=1 Tax=Kingella denitrificans ATCC 33394 TaxID=888741 RepID=F0F069_9NEIS|nr:hypothetical protein HMPREF9098_1503 [Kingella denitrificans ATCC 33394]